jgi:hypothetical protein
VSEVTIGDVMRAYAEDAVDYGQRRMNITLDFSERSLEDVDRIIANWNNGDLVVPDELADAEREDFWVFCKIMGGYVGEVIIRNIGGEWRTTDIGDGAASVKILVTGDIEGSPPEAVWRALTEPFKAMASYYRGLKAILGHGQQTTENGIRTVHLPPLSDKPPNQGGREQRSW